MSVELIRKVWPEWKVEAEIGRGSYGVVYRAVRDDADYQVKSYSAIKVISVPGNDSDVNSLMSEGVSVEGSQKYYKEIVDQFVREIGVMQSLRGIQNIVAVEDYRVVERSGSVGWDILIRMELLIPFNTFAMNNEMKEEDVIRLGIDICTALEYCERRNIIHRDIKPENIFVNDFGIFKLGDFGIARSLENMSVSMTQKGTLLYMAPEVVRGGGYDSRVDIYSLGLVLYRMLNNKRPPFINTDSQMMSPAGRNAAIRRRLEGELLPPPTQASRQMANLILRACSFDPNSRFMNAAQMREALQSVRNGSYKMFSIFTASTVDVGSTEFAAMNVPEAENAPYNYSSPAADERPVKNKAIPVVIAAAVAVAVISIVAVITVFALNSGGQNDVSQTSASVSSYPENDPHSSTEESDPSHTQSSAMTVENSRDALIYNSLEKSNEYLQAKDYAKANAVLDDAENIVGKNDKIDQQRLLIRRTEFSDQLGSFEDSQNYSEAIKYMDENKDEWQSWDNSQQYADWYDSFVDSYRKQVLDAAAMLYGDDDIDGAIAKLEEGLEVLPEDSRLSAKLQEYQTAKPESIILLKITKGESYSFVNQAKDTRGISYDDALCLDYHFDNWVMYSGNVEMYTGKKYSRFTCTIVPDEDFDTYVLRNGEGARIQIYGDDELIYSSDIITYKTEGIDVDIDISDVSYLRIEVVKDAFTGLQTPRLDTLLVSPLVYKKAQSQPQ